MIVWQFEPLPSWPYQKTADPRSSRTFRASWPNTLKLLERELEHLDVTGAVAIQVDADPTSIRRDGMLYARARVGFQGVRVSFTSKHGPLTYATDAYDALYSNDPPGWQANVRAIALGLEALRAVDRYGITRTGEQYAGWRQLTAGEGESTTGQAIALLLATSGRAAWPASRDEQMRVWRAARLASHPDRNNGDRTDWDRVEVAAAVLGLGGDR